MPKLYPLFRPLFFAIDPEAAHDIVFRGLDVAAALGVAQLSAPHLPASPVNVMGIEFPNRVGLAAGLDKNAAHLRGLATLGFGFLEVGTVTPRPQPGNAKPRMFRLERSEALINRLGFNNDGVDRLVHNVTHSRYRGVLGINIGRNFETPNERAADDYVACMRAIYPYASYITINISSPNTKGLRDLHAEDAFGALLGNLKSAESALAEKHGRRVPLVVKIAPDLDRSAIEGIARLLVRHRIDGVIATNTTLGRDGVIDEEQADQAGGLSGKPLRDKSTAVIRTLAKALDGALPIIGVGGIFSGADAHDKIDAGAMLVQIYTGLIYRGPALVAECVKALAAAPR
jgi:dihydroorotate dehydrogenase